MIPPHPATFTPTILAKINLLLRDGVTVLDPFAGVGTIHLLRPRVLTFGIELEPEWAAADPHTRPGDATDLPYAADEFHYVVTSPCYGNRMADHHNAQDGSRRMTYRHYLGRPLTAGSAGMLQWGPAYRELHMAAWTEAHRVAAGLILNVKDHVRRGELQGVPEWHLGACLAIGYRLVQEIQVPVPGMRYGENHGARVDHEMIYVMERDT